jgi:hypothetical protein
MYLNSNTPSSYLCNCACSRCMSGGCCLRPAPNWYPIYPWDWSPYYPQVTTGTVTIKSGLICPKCGSQEIGTRWHQYESVCQRPSNEGPEGEHLHRTCQNCGYHWKSPVL